VIDLGPEGGDKGGEIVAVGTPEQVAEEARSYTGGYLREILENSKRVPPQTAPARISEKRAISKCREREAAE
jgi:excinuclease ABC subunit A